MTQEQFNKGKDLIDQIKRLDILKNNIQRDYDKYKNKEENKQLLETLEWCRNVTDILQEIDQQKFKDL